jgi:hypothetical protein
MATCHLRLYPELEQGAAADSEQEATVTIRLGDLFPLLRHAVKKNYAWVKDFENDEVRVTPDFYDVVRAFMGLRPSA